MIFCYLVSTLWNPGQVRAANNCRQGPHPQETELWQWSCQQMSMDRPKRVSSSVNGSWCCCMSPTAQMLFGEKAPQDNAESQSKEQRGATEKTTLYKFRESGMELKNLRRTQHWSANRKKGTPLSKGAQNSWAASTYKNVEQYHHKNTEKSCLLMPLSSHSISGFRGSLGVSASRFC